MKLKRVLFHLILLIFCGLTLWWLFYFPYDATRIYRVLPQDAQIITEHELPAGRLEALSANPAVQRLLADAGVDPDANSRFFADPRATALVRHLAGRKVLFAYAERFGPASRPTRVLASWIGWRTQVVKLALWMGRAPGFKRLAQPSPTPIWVRTLAGGHRAQTVALAAFEGLLVATISEDPQAMMELVTRQYAGAARMPSLIYHLDRENNWQKDAATDRAWVSWACGSRKRRTRLVMAAGIEKASDSELSGWARLIYAPPSGQTFPATEALTRMRQTLGTRPQGELVCPLAYLQPILSDPRATWTERFAFETLTKVMPRHQSLGLSFLTDDYRGRILVLNVEQVERSLSISVPTLVLCLPVDDASRTTDLLHTTLDRINAELKLSLIPHELPSAPFPLYVIDDVSGNAYSRMPQEQKVAVAILDDRLLLSTNFKNLHALLVDHSARNAMSPAEIDGSQSVPAYLHLDLEAVCPDIAKLLTYCQLIASQSGRQSVAVATEWVKAVQSFGDLELRLRAEGDQLLVRFRLGPVPQPARATAPAQRP